MPHKPPFDNKAHISGQNLFVSAYHGFTTLGNEHIPVLQRFVKFPPFAVCLANAVKQDGNLVIPAAVPFLRPGRLDGTGCWPSRCLLYRGKESIPAA